VNIGALKASLRRQKGTKKMEEFDLLMDVCRAFFGLLFGLLLGTVILFEGFWGGAIFYVVAVYSAVWLIVSILKLKIKTKHLICETKESEVTE
jgi:hypothetical protein